MKCYLVDFRQSGDGCDHTIGCGRHSDVVHAEDPREALQKAVTARFGNDFDPDGDIAMAWVRVYEVVGGDGGGNWAAWVEQRRAEVLDASAAAARRADEALFERLRKKLGR